MNPNAISQNCLLEAVRMYKVQSEASSSPPAPRTVLGRGPEEHWLRATPVRWGFFAVDRAEGAPGRLLRLLISDVATCRALPASRGESARKARAPRLFHAAAVLLMSPPTEWTARWYALNTFHYHHHDYITNCVYSVMCWSSPLLGGVWETEWLKHVWWTMHQNVPAGSLTRNM